MDYQAIKLEARAQQCRVTDLLALAPQNDPFYIGQPAQLEKARWFADLWDRFGYGHGVHLRRIHYRLVSQDPPILKPNGEVYENTDNDWKCLNSASKYARYLDLVPLDDFVDRRNPDPIVNAEWHEDPQPAYQVHDGGEWYEHVLPALPELSDLPYRLPHQPGFFVSGYDRIQQPYIVEVWAEKTTMNDVLEPLCQQYGVNLVTGAGELSITAVADLLGRVRESNRGARILYVSDFDPAGLGMPISVARKIEFEQWQNGAGHSDIRLQPIVLTAEQVREYRLPRVPVKDSDRRKANFEADHGKGQVELDALEALHPGELAGIVEQAILDYRDPGLQRRAWSQERKLEGDLTKERNRILEDFSNDLDGLNADYQELRAAFAITRQQFAELVADFQAQISAHQERLDAIKGRCQEMYGQVYERLEDVNLDVGDYPLPDPELPPETDGLLYDSRRGYFEQLEHYEAHRNGVELRGNGIGEV